MLSLNKKTGHELLYYSYQVSNVFSLLHTHIFPLSVYIVPIFYFILTVYTLYTGYSVTPVYIHDQELSMVAECGQHPQFCFHTSRIFTDSLFFRKIQFTALFFEISFIKIRIHFFQYFFYIRNI